MTAPNAALDYGDPRGSRSLREVLAGYLRRVRGRCRRFRTDSHLCRVRPGTPLPRVPSRSQRTAGGPRRSGNGDGETLAAAARAGWETVPVPVSTAASTSTLSPRAGVRVVVVTPAHQWPTGVVMAPERRHALVTWADRHDATIIEDDYDAEFRYDREPVGVVQGLAPGRVIVVGTVSKSLAPAVRLGWILCPPSLVETVTEERG